MLLNQTFPAKVGKVLFFMSYAGWALWLHVVATKGVRFTGTKPTGAANSQ